MNCTDEILRINELKAYRILDTPPESAFDELVELATMVSGCAIALISLIDEDRQWFKSKIGIDETEVKRDVAFCNFTMLQEDVFVVEDTLASKEYRDHPLMNAVHLRFYAGMPIFSAAGYKLGTICVVDKRPKIFLPKQVAAMRILSHQVTRLLELRLVNQMLEDVYEIKN